MERLLATVALAVAVCFILLDTTGVLSPWFDKLHAGRSAPSTEPKVAEAPKPTDEAELPGAFCREMVSGINAFNRPVVLHGSCIPTSPLLYRHCGCLIKLHVAEGVSLTQVSFLCDSTRCFLGAHP